ncbi:MAG TPA: hypothetical protein VF669_08525 [Tepidisphaeraceae bacterium]
MEKKTVEHRGANQDEEGLRRRENARQSLVAGAITVLMSFVLVWLAYLLNNATVNKYLILLAFLLFCAGAGMLFNAAWDRRGMR